MATETKKAQSEKTQKLFELINDIEYAMLVTETEDGQLRSRPMSAKTTETDKNIWFLTHKDSAKILEIKENCKVNVCFSRPSNYSFISVTGTACVMDDQDMIEKVWTADAGLWFPEGKEDPNLTLIRVKPSEAEYWCSDEGMFVSLFKMAKAAVNGEEPELGTNEKVQL